MIKRIFSSAGLILLAIVVITISLYGSYYLYQHFAQTVGLPELDFADFVFVRILIGK